MFSIQVRELIAENERKDAVIKKLSLEIEDRQAKLTLAQIKIEKLEQRIKELEIKNGRLCYTLMHLSMIESCTHNWSKSTYAALSKMYYFFLLFGSRVTLVLYLEANFACIQGKSCIP